MVLSCSQADPSRRRQQEAYFDLGKWLLLRDSESASSPEHASKISPQSLDRVERSLAPGTGLVMQNLLLIRNNILLNIRTSTSGCVRASGILISRTTGEEARKEGGEGTLEHGQTGTYDRGVGFDGRPDGRVECTVHLVFGFGSGIKGSHPQD